MPRSLHWSVGLRGRRSKQHAQKWKGGNPKGERTYLRSLSKCFFGFICAMLVSAYTHHMQRRRLLAGGTGGAPGGVRLRGFPNHRGQGKKRQFSRAVYSCFSHACDHGPRIIPFGGRTGHSKQSCKYSQNGDTTTQRRVLSGFANSPTTSQRAL